MGGGRLSESDAPFLWQKVPGWAEFEDRRKAKVGKQIESRVTADFDEGADYVLWDKWE